MDWHDLDFWVLRLGIGLLLVTGVAQLIVHDVQRLLRAFLRLLRLFPQNPRSSHRPSRRSNTVHTNPWRKSHPRRPNVHLKPWRLRRAPR